MWRRHIQRAFSHDVKVSQNLQRVCPDGATKLEELKAEGPGIITWLVEGRLSEHTIGEKGKP
jgi:hypothetical protein